MDGPEQSDSVPDTDVDVPGQAFDQWAIVDVMGHQRYVGRVSEQTIAGKGFVRIDVPASDDQPAFTKLLGTQAIYSISPVSETVARAMCKERTQRPIDAYDLPSLPAGTQALVDHSAEYET